MFKNIFGKKDPEPQDGCPTLFPIAHDDYHAKDIGSLPDGTQYFITGGFVPQGKDDNPPRREFISLYLFKPDGTLIKADIREFSGAEADWTRHREELQEVLERCGTPKPGDIEVRPFSLKRFDVEFGLIPLEPAEPGDDWSVILEPGNFMAFYPPWNGDYDT